MNKTGYAIAPQGKRMMSAMVDFMLLMLTVLIMQMVLNQLFVNKMIQSTLEEHKIAEVNAEYNLVVWKDEKSKDKKENYIFSQLVFDEIAESQKKYDEYSGADPDVQQELLDAAKRYCLVYEADSNIPGDVDGCVLSKDQAEAYFDKVREADSIVTIYVSLAIVLAALIAGLIFSFAIPMLLGQDRQTIGRKMFKLGLRTTKGQTVRWPMMVIRLLIGVVIEFGLSIIYFMPITVIASIGLSVITKRRQTFRDFFSTSVVVDLMNPIGPEENKV